MTRILLKLIFAVYCFGLMSQQSVAGQETIAQKSVESSKKEIKGDINAASQAWALIESGALLIDVRSAGEFEVGHIPGSVNIPHTEIETLAQAIGPGLDRSVVFYCASGRRAGRAQEQLEQLGYTGLFNASGYDALLASKP